MRWAAFVATPIGSSTSSKRSSSSPRFWSVPDGIEGADRAVDGVRDGQRGGFGAHAGADTRHTLRLDQPGSATIASISTAAPSGSAATPISVRAGGACWKNAAVGLVDRGERRDVGDVDRAADRVLQPRRPPAAQTTERFSRQRVGLLAERPLDQLAGRRVEGDLPRAEQQARRGRPRGSRARRPPGRRRR